MQHSIWTLNKHWTIFRKKEGIYTNKVVAKTATTYYKIVQLTFSQYVVCIYYTCILYVRHSQASENIRCRCMYMCIIQQCCPYMLFVKQRKRTEQQKWFKHISPSIRPFVSNPFLRKRHTIFSPSSSSVICFAVQNVSDVATTTTTKTRTPLSAKKTKTKKRNNVELYFEFENSRVLCVMKRVIHTHTHDNI